MGGGASSQAAFEQMIAATMILGEAMVQGLDPRFVRFPGETMDDVKMTCSGLMAVAHACYEDPVEIDEIC